MKRAVVIAVIALALTACKVEKTGQDTYKVVTPTPEAKRQGAKAAASARQLGKEIGEKSKEAGAAIQNEINEHAASDTSTVKTETVKTGTNVTTSTTATVKK